jgi:hypothetical protein
LRVFYFLPQYSCANRNKHLTASERLKEGDWNVRYGGTINEGDAYRVLVKPEGKGPFGRRKCIWENNTDFVSLYGLITYLRANKRYEALLYEITLNTYYFILFPTAICFPLTLIHFPTYQKEKNLKFSIILYNHYEG